MTQPRGPLRTLLVPPILYDDPKALAQYQREHPGVQLVRAPGRTPVMPKVLYDR